MFPESLVKVDRVKIRDTQQRVWRSTEVTLPRVEDINGRKRENVLKSVGNT